MPELTDEQAAALGALGLDADQFESFALGLEIVFYFPTQSDPGIALAQWQSERIRCGIFSIDDPGGGLITLMQFRSNAQRLASAFEAEELELFGAALLNDKLRELLIRRSFERKVVGCPEALGGGEMEILSKVFQVSI